jgi:hypothetical protein
LAIIVTDLPRPAVSQRIGGHITVDKQGEIVKHEGGRETTLQSGRVGQLDQPMRVRTEEGPKTRANMKRVLITGDDQKHTKEILKDHFPKTRDVGLANVEKQEREQRDGEWVRYNSEVKLRLSKQDAARALQHMRRTQPKGPPATRPTFSMGARLVNGKLVRSEEE